MIGDRWGVTDAEVEERYPCDDVVRRPALAAWRGVTVAAPPAVVWPWVGQLRVAPYSYDLVDNLGRRSPRRLLDLPEPVEGEPFTRAFGRPQGRIVSVTPQVQLTGRLLGSVLSYVLVPLPDEGGEGVERTRLLLKIVVRGARWAAPAISVGDLVMARRQLLTLARLAEGQGGQGRGEGAAGGGPASRPA